MELKAWQICSLESTGTGLQLSFEDFPGGVVVGWGRGKAGNKAYLSPASAGAWAELGNNDNKDKKQTSWVSDEY